MASLSIGRGKISPRGTKVVSTRRDSALQPRTPTTADMVAMNAAGAKQPKMAER